LFDRDGVLVTTNDNWRSSQATEIMASGLAPSDDRESAIIRVLAPGNYTAVVRGVDDSSGIALVEVYDLGAEDGSRLANISTRGPVETGDNVLIGGLILRGNQPRNILLRAIGPELESKGVKGALQDPIMELHDPNGALLATNDNWKDSQKVEVEATGLPPKDDRESAILRRLSPGNYTAVVRGKNALTGIALIEAYDVEGR